MRRPRRQRIRDFPSIELIPSERRATLKETNQYYKMKDKIPHIILGETESHEVIHGEFAVQRHLPKRYHRHTGDIDILTKTPMVDARETEKALDRHAKMDLFYITPGQHPGTFRVRNRANRESVADYTRPDGQMPPHTRIGRHNFVTRNYIIKHSQGVLSDPLSEYRSAKEQDTINRLKLGKRRKK